MRSLAEARTRWQETLKYTGNLDGLRRAARHNGSSSPCVAGCRSLCWKIFLLFPNAPNSEWADSLSASRQEYTKHSEHLLRFLKHPEELANVSIDPLADDPESPWNTLRQDETIRAEIAQDVQRLPDEPFYHEESTQTMIVDTLFVYCKLHPNGGGYRQGMHELLAPIIWVLHQDAINSQEIAEGSTDDLLMLHTLDSAYIEHDAYSLFSKIMERAQAFYEVRDSITKSALASASRNQAESSAIVEKSKHIHEVCLAKVDPELARHLTDVEILPQIFLIRWVRLLFGREFPFDQLLVLWDALFAVDPSLDLIDLVCVAMLIRIRWSLLEADYSHCLQLLLKYPAPSEHHGPHTFVEDAVYLKDHLDASAGASLTLKYTGKLPSETPVGNKIPPSPTLKPQSPQRIRLGRSPLSSPGKFIQQQGGMEAIFQGAAKNMLERGEKLGINQAVRDAMGEIKKNVQGLNDVRYSPQGARQMLFNDSAARTIAAMEKRNKLLAGMLDESIDNLKSLATTNTKDKVKTLELIETAAAKVQFVKIHLEDSTIDISGLDALDTDDTKNKPGEDATDVTMAEAEEGPSPKEKGEGAEDAASAIARLDIKAQTDTAPHISIQGAASSVDNLAADDAMDVSDNTAAEPGSPKSEAKSPDTKENRPQPPIPTRSTLAQSSFSWMLEPDETASHSKNPLGPPSPRSSRSNAKEDTATVRNKRSMNNASRQKNAFLFGEVTTESEGKGQPTADDIFGMEPLASKGKKSGNAPF